MEQNYRILIVDEDQAFTSAVASALSTYDEYEICGIADNGNSALEMISQLQPDLVLMDLILPQVDGFGVMERIREQSLGKLPRFMLLTSFSRPGMAKRAMELDADYYMVKPIDMDDLLNRLWDIQALSQAVEAALPHFYSQEERVTSFLSRIGIPAQTKGYQYLDEALNEACRILILPGGEIQELNP